MNKSKEFKNCYIIHTSLIHIVILITRVSEPSILRRLPAPKAQNIVYSWINFLVMFLEWSKIYAFINSNNNISTGCIRVSKPSGSRLRNPAYNNIKILFYLEASRTLFTILYLAGVCVDPGSDPVPGSFLLIQVYCPSCPVLPYDLNITNLLCSRLKRLR